MSVILTASNNTRGISEGRFTPHYTLELDSLNTVGKALHLESAQFELHVPSLLEGKNTFYVEELRELRTPAEHETFESKIRHHIYDLADIVKKTAIVVKPATYSNVNELVAGINDALKAAGKHNLVTFKTQNETGKLAVDVAAHARLEFMAKTSPLQVFGLSTEGRDHIHIEGPVTDVQFHYALDLSDGKRQVLLYCDVIPPSIEYRDNSDSRILKTFPVLTLNGINNYIFSEENKRHMLPVTQLNTITFWLKFNDGDYITSGYPIYLDLRVSDIS